MSDTPRTDKEELTQTQRYGCRMVRSDFARELERDLSKVTQAMDTSHKAFCYSLNENARLIENEKSMNDQICLMANAEGRLREALVDLADLSRDRRTTRIMMRDRIAAILLPNVQAQRRPLLPDNRTI